MTRHPKPATIARQRLHGPRSLALVAFAAMAVLGLTTTFSQAQPQPDAPKMLRHVVLFQFKASSSPEDVRNVVDEFRKLPSQISEIADFEYGVNNSPEGLDGGLTHCFLVTFKSEADRDAYLPHPAHQKFVEVLKPHLEKATVVDYWAQR